MKNMFTIQAIEMDPDIKTSRAFKRNFDEAASQKNLNHLTF